MRILIDLLSLGYGGSETYPLEMLPRLAASDHEFLLILTMGYGEALRKALPSRMKLIEAPARTRNPFHRAIYQKRRLPEIASEQAVDVVFVPGGLTGYRRRSEKDPRLVIMVRNMLCFDARERGRFGILQYPWKRFRLTLLSRGIKKACSRADRVIGVSRHCGESMNAQVTVKDSRVIPHGVSSPSAPENPADPQFLERYGIRRPYLLYVSILSPYKHQDVIIEGFERFRSGTRRSDFQLVLAGPAEGPYGESILRRAKASEGAILCPGSVPRSALPGLMSQAEMLLFGSTCEACPNILLEYLAAGRPIICSRSAPMPEFGGDAVQYVEAEKPEEWIEAITRVLDDPNLSKELSTRAAERASKYSWHETAQQTLKALTQW